MLRCICGPGCVSLPLFISYTHNSISRVWCLLMNNALVYYLGVQMWLCFCMPTLSHNYLYTGTNTASFLVTGQCLPDLRGPPGMVVNSIRITCVLGCGCSSVVNHQHALSLQYCQEKKEKPSLRWQATTTILPLACAWIYPNIYVYTHTHEKNVSTYWLVWRTEG